MATHCSESKGSSFSEGTLSGQQDGSWKMRPGKEDRFCLPQVYGRCPLPQPAEQLILQWLEAVARGKGISSGLEICAPRAAKCTRIFGQLRATTNKVLLW